MKKFSIGDRVIMSKKKVIGANLNWSSDIPITAKIPYWFSTSHYTIIGIDKEVVSLDKNLPNDSGNRINVRYLKSLKKERKKKLLKLKSL